MHPRFVLRRPRAGAGLALGSLAATLVLAACGSGGPGVASLGAAGSSPTPSGGSGSKAQSSVTFSQCMRQHGITNFPDPGSRGEVSINGGPGSGLDINSPQFQSAQAACRSLLPNNGVPDPSQQAAFQAAALAVSRCMRAHGIADFPDPQFHSTGGGGGVTLKLPDSINAKSPQFQAAMQACQSLLPKPPGAVTSQGGSGSDGGTVQGGGGK